MTDTGSQMSCQQHTAQETWTIIRYVTRIHSCRLPCSVLLPWMTLPMPDEAGAVGEGFSTLLTAIRLLSSVCFLVFQKVGATVEGLSTLTTFKGLLTGVDSLMLGDIGAVSEGFPTLVTLKGLLSSVNSLVANVICLVFKDSSTFTALIGLLPLERNKDRDTLKVIFK